MPPTNLKIPSPIVGQLSLAGPRAAVVTELIKETYPLLLNSAPVHGLVQGAGRQYIPTPLFVSEVANDAV